MAAVETDCPADKRVVHIVKVSRCLEYINTKHVPNIVSWMATKISSTARPTRKHMVAFLKIFSGSKKNMKSSRPFTTMDMSETMSK